MKAAELRIGNLLNPVVKGFVLNSENHAVDYSTIGLVNGDVHSGEIKFIGIPLNKEWYEKLGFRRVDHIDGYSFWTLSKSRKNDCHIDIYDNKTTFMGYLVNKCEYVHQVQNLYFSVKGEEIKL